MLNLKIILCVAATLLLLACDADISPPDPTNEANAETLCVNSICGDVIEMVGIPDAENIHFTPEGRLFVTGGANAYEVIKHLDETFEAIPLIDLTDLACGFTGMAQKGHTMYFVCGDGQLFAADMDDISNVRLIYQMDGMCIANGTALGPDGNLYVVDEPLDPACLPLDPKIVRLNVAAGDSMTIESQETWVDSAALGLMALGVGTDPLFPNGLAVKGSRFYATDGGTVFYVDLLEDGSAGPITPIYFKLTAHDDLSIAGESLLIADFLQGSIYQLSFDGAVLQQTNPLTFDFPSAVQLARPPMFRADDILVTEKGLLLEQNLPIDVLSVFRRNTSAK